MVAEEARKMRVAQRRSELRAARGANAAETHAPTCRHCPGLSPDRLEQALMPLSGHVLLKRDAPTAVHIAVAGRPFATYCEYLRHLRAGAGESGRDAEVRAAERYEQRFRIAR